MNRSKQAGMAIKPIVVLLVSLTLASVHLADALDHGMFFIASTGTRTALDVLIVDKIGDIGNFKEKIDELVK